MIKHTISFLTECYFCDSKVCHIVPAHSATKEGVPIEHQKESFQVICDNCGACGPTKRTENDAADAWGTGRDDCQNSERALEDQDNKSVDLQFLDEIKNYIIVGQDDSALKMINTWIKDLT